MTDRDPPRRYYAAAIRGDRVAMRAMIEELRPVVYKRVQRVINRRRGATRGRALGQDTADFVSEVFVALFENQARALSAWDETRGLSLSNFVGLIAEREVASILRSGRRSPWTEDPTEIEELDSGDPAPTPDVVAASRELLSQVLDELRIRVSPRGYWLFEELFVKEQSVAELAERSGMSDASLYAWRSRLMKLAKQIAADFMSETAARRVDQSEGDRE